MRTFRVISAVIAALVTVTFGAWAECPSGEQTVSDTDQPTPCIMISRIDHIEVLDDQTILFHMIDGKVWKNVLPFPCVGLKFEGGISYDTSIDQLCREDIFTVIHRETTCGFGEFHLVSDGSGQGTGPAGEDR